MINLIAIFNCSPLMYLAKIGFLPICEKLFAKCVTSPEVSRELLRKEHVPERPILEKALKSWITIEEPENSTDVLEFKQMGLHPGEAEIITIAQKMHNQSLSQEKDDQIENTYIVVIDETDAREICLGLQLHVTGTIGVLLFATRRGLITSIQCENFLDKLVDTTFYLSAKMLSSIRQEVDLIKQIK